MEQKGKVMEDATLAVHAGESNPNGGVTTPIDRSSTFEQDSSGEIGDLFYARIDNPTRRALEEKVAALEHGERALIFASGMAAISTMILALVKSGEEVLICNDSYGGTQGLLKKIISKFGIGVTFADPTDPAEFTNHIHPNARLVLIESPTNPLLKISDIEKISELARQHPGVIVAVDNTFATPLGQRPLEMGAHISIHSLTKYISGHSDVIAGAIIANDSKILEKITATRSLTGTGLDPDSCARVMQYSKTLHVRMKIHENNAFSILRALNQHLAVEWVLYPGSSDHPQYELAREQMNNFGGVVTFKLKGNINNTRVFLDNLEVFTHAVSLGGVESLIEVPALMTHQSMTEEEKEASGIDETVIRVAVGIEDRRDLVKAMNRALDASVGVLLRESVGAGHWQDGDLQRAISQNPIE